MKDERQVEVKVKKQKGKLLGAARPNVPSGTGGGTRYWVRRLGDLVTV
ncbi:MAG: hypothetical protein KAX05_10325 [Bacteroidales bacterium]|nr:hypothetical protein [Bacteroidales bacterium]